MKGLKILIFYLSIAFCLAASCSKDGSEGSNGNCYFGISYNDTFNRAEHFCSNLFGHLASITNVFDNSVVLNMARDIFANAENVWLGGTYDGESIAWNDGSPDIYQNFQKASVAGNIVLNLSSGKWSTATWNANLPYICMEQNAPQTMVPTESCPLTPPCPTEWTYSASLKTCYRVIFNVNLEAADADCRLMGAVVASIHSDEENRVINELTKTGTPVSRVEQEPLIGGQRTGLGINDWKWSDGSPWNYTNWGPGQPDNFQGKEYCLELMPDNTDQNYIQKWNDCDCSTINRAAVCKQPAKY